MLYFLQLYEKSCSSTRPWLQRGRWLRRWRRWWLLRRRRRLWLARRWPGCERYKMVLKRWKLILSWNTSERNLPMQRMRASFLFRETFIKNEKTKNLGVFRLSKSSVLQKIPDLFPFHSISRYPDIRQFRYPDIAVQQMPSCYPDNPNIQMFRYPDI